MNTKILIAALAGLSLVAAAQSPTDKQKTKPSTMQTQHKDVAAGQVSGGKAAQDDWHQTAAKPASGSTTKPTHVAVGDVNGDGRADLAVSKNSAHATESQSVSAGSSSKEQTPRDAASGQTSGKRQHQPLTITKTTDKASQ